MHNTSALYERSHFPGSKRCDRIFWQSIAEKPNSTKTDFQEHVQTSRYLFGYKKFFLSYKQAYTSTL